MWRRGDRLYALLVLGVVFLEALALGWLVWTFTGRLLGVFPYPVAWRALLWALGATASALVLLGLYLIAYHLYSARQESYFAYWFRSWLDRFMEALLEDRPLPRPPWPRPALEALLALRETLKGEMGDRVLDLLRQARPPWMRVLRSRLASRTSRLEALEALAKARLPEALGVILPYLEHPDPVLRLAAARAAARSTGEETAPALAPRLLRARLSRGALLEVLLLLEEKAERVVPYLLASGDERAQWAALEAIGRLRLPLTGAVLPFLAAENPELKAAALRAFYRLGYFPKGQEEKILEALLAPEDYLRLHAARLLALGEGSVPRRLLWWLLKDPSFHVRRAAAEALGQLDREALAQAAQSHPDPYGRAMAAHVLREGRWAS